MKGRAQINRASVLSLSLILDEKCTISQFNKKIMSLEIYLSKDASVGVSIFECVWFKNESNLEAVRRVLLWMQVEKGQNYLIINEAWFNRIRKMGDDLVNWGLLLGRFEEKLDQWSKGIPMRMRFWMRKQGSEYGSEIKNGGRFSQASE